MLRLALAATGLSLACAAATSAAIPMQPSDRACLIAWNSPANRAGHVKLLEQRPIRGLMLRAGVSYVDRWTKTSSTRVGGPACILTIVKRGELRLVTGAWKSGGVDHWMFAPKFAATKNYPPPAAANVRLLADGRVTKIYR